MAHNQTVHFEHHRRETELTRHRFRIVILFLFMGLSVAVGLQYHGILAASTPEIASGLPGLCLNDPGGSTVNGTNVAIGTCDGSAGEHFIVSGQQVKTGLMCLAPNDGLTSNRTPVHVWACDGASDQNWTYSGNKLVNVKAGICLDDPGSSTKPGTQLDIYTCNGTGAQKWTTTTYTPPPPPPTPTPNPTPVPTPNPTPVHTPTPTPPWQAPSPTPDPGTGGGSGGDGSGGGTSPTGSPGAGSGSATPDAPGGFTAAASGTNAVIDLAWSASSDAAGIANYQLERSEDQNLWTVVSGTIVDTGYSDQTVTFGVHYYYRVEAIDNAAVVSAYAFADATTPDFSSNASTDNSTPYSSDDHLATVVLPAGAVDGSSDCSVSSDPSHSFANSALRLVAGPYTLVCKDAAGNPVQTFNKPLAWTFDLKDKLKGLSNPLAYSMDASSKLTLVKNATYSSAHNTLTFTSTTPNSVLVMASVNQAVPWSALVALLLAIGAIAGVVVLILRKKQKSNYDDYLRSKYYNL